MRAPIVQFTSRTVVMPASNIDTDQIIPARFLKMTDKKGLGAKLFADWRYDANGALRAEFVLNRPEAAGAQILIAGQNFGCGSSREHAPWALVDFGFRAVVSASIADIFRSNAVKNGLLPILVEPAVHQVLLEQPGREVTVNLQTQQLTLPDGQSVTFPIDPFARYCLLTGNDELGYLLSQTNAITDYEGRMA